MHVSENKNEQLKLYPASDVATRIFHWANFFMRTRINCHRSGDFK